FLPDCCAPQHHCLTSGTRFSVKMLRIALLAALVSAGLAGFVDPAFGQTTYTWNNTSTDPTLATSWTSASGSPGVPGVSDAIQFNVLGTFGPSTPTTPGLTVPAGATQISASGSATFQGWTLSGTGSLTTTGPTATNSLTPSGAGTFTINGPTLA